MNSQEFLIVVFVLLCAAISFFMSGMEAGVLALSPLRIRQMKRAGDPRAKVLQSFLERPENFLWTILVGNTFANFTVLSFVVVGLATWFHGQMLVRILIFVAFAFLFYTVCELLPKMLFRNFPNRLCLVLARPFRAVHLVLTPVVALVAWFSRWLLRWTGGRRFTGNIFGNRDELRFMIQESSQAFTSEEKAMVNRVLDLQSIHLRQIITPMTSAITVSTDASMGEVLQLVREKNVTRVPVWKQEGERRRVVGILSIKGLLFSSDLNPAKKAGDFVKPGVYLSEDLSLEETLHRLRRSGQRLAIVLGRDQREIGIVSLEDILKTIFGEVNL